MRKPVPPSHRSRGLTQAQAAERLAQYGPNIVAEAKPAGLGQILVRQFMSPFIYILLIAAAVSLAIGQVQNTVFILAVLAINAGIGAYQEFAAGKAALALRDMVRGQATVIRDGQRKRIDARDLVPGDWVVLESGDKVPADLSIRHEAGLSVDESMLTGESHAVEKEEGDEAFGGTIVTRGRAEGEVTATGADTEIGAIARSVTAAAFAEPPLMGRIKRFTQTMAIAILGAIALLVGVMALNGAYSGQDMVMMAVGLAVSAIPEGLPAALTVTLAIGMNRMAKRNAIIRRLVAVEALGSCTVIASDKTGTLTVNELTIRRVTLPDGETFEIEGAGILPEGRISGGDPARLHALAVAAVHANEARLFRDDGQWIGEGDAVDLAFLAFARKAGLNVHDIKEREAWLAAMPYESERAWSGTLARSADGPCLHVKGSLERVLPMCGAMAGADGPIELDVAAVQAQAHVLARRGFKVLAVASGVLPGAAAVPESPQGLVFQGIAGMIDPLRPEAAEAVERCRKAGIRVVMVTGDHPETARAIAADLGLIRYDDADTVIGGDALEADFSRGEGDAEVERARVFARISPDLKRRIAESLIRNGHFVAMTGDGVNDAPALRHANVGIAMGRRGTDVARETADVILADDHFASIVNGVEEGRIVYANIRKVIALLVATGASAILLFFLAALFGLPMPMTAVQLLWLNLVANGLQDVALAFEPGEGDELKRGPRDPAQPIFERHLLTHVMVNGAWMGLAAFALFWWTQMQAMELAAAQNLVLMLMVLFGNVHAWNSRSETRPPYRLRPFANPFLLCAIAGAQAVHIAAMHLPVISDVLGLHPIAPETWAALLAVAASLFVIDTLVKRSGGRHS